MSRTTIFSSVQEEIQWLTERAREAEDLALALDQCADSLDQIAEQKGGSVLQPSTLERLSDLGRSKAGVQESLRAGKALNQFAMKLQENPEFVDAADEILFEKQEAIVPGEGILTRPRTQFQLRSQEADLRLKAQAIKQVKRRLRYRLRRIESYAKQASIYQKMDALQKNMQKSLKDR